MVGLDARGVLGERGNVEAIDQARLAPKTAFWPERETRIVMFTHSLASATGTEAAAAAARRKESMAARMWLDGGEGGIESHVYIRRTSGSRVIAARNVLHIVVPDIVIVDPPDSDVARPSGDSAMISLSNSLSSRSSETSSTQTRSAGRLITGSASSCSVHDGVTRATSRTVKSVGSED